jgi:hypothetical protein
MARGKQSGNRKSANFRNAASKRRAKETPRENAQTFSDLLSWFIGEVQLFAKDHFHGNVKWLPEELACQALIWAWHEAKNVTDAFDQADEVCGRLELDRIAKSYTSFMNALHVYREPLQKRMRLRFQELAEQVAGRFWSRDEWVLLGFDGSRATTPRSVDNEQAFCAPNYGKSSKAKRRKKKAAAKIEAGQRQPSKQPHPQVPQTWITMMWHMSLKLPWTWRLGPSNSCERQHVREMIQQEKFPENTLFCGDAGFVGYPLWKEILDSGKHFLVRVGANVHLLSEHADILGLGGGVVLCWPKGQMQSGGKPLRLRLVQVTVGKTKAWMLTSVLDEKRLPRTKIVTYYKMRWGIEVEFRGLKQTLDKHTLRCRSSHRVLVELDWSIRAMAVAELMALAQQIKQPRAKDEAAEVAYDPKHRSLANTMRAIRKCMRNLNDECEGKNELMDQLCDALIQKYKNHTDKKARYRPANKDKKPLGDPHVRQMTSEERERLRKTQASMAA